MKKRNYLLAVAIGVTFMCGACNNSEQVLKNDFSGVIRDVNLSITKEEIIEMEYDLSGVNYTSEEIYEGDTVLYYEDMNVNGYLGKLTYRIEESGTLGFVQFKFDKDEDFDSFMKDFENQYGTPSKEKDYYVVWYGSLDGEKAMFTASEDLSLIEIARN